MSIRSNVSIMVRTADLNKFRQNKAWEFKTAFCDYNGALEPCVFFNSYKASFNYMKKNKLVHVDNEHLTLITLEDVRFYGTRSAREILNFLDSLDYFELHNLSEDDEGNTELEYLADAYTLEHGGLIDCTDELCIKAEEVVVTL